MQQYNLKINFMNALWSAWQSVLLFTLSISHRAIIYRLAEETICYLAFWNIVFSIFPMLMINRIRENSSVQERSSSCRVPSPRQRIYCGDFQGSKLQGVTPWMEEQFEMMLYAPTTFESTEQFPFPMHTTALGSSSSATNQPSPFLLPDNLGAHGWGQTGAKTGNSSIKVIPNRL